MINPKQYIKSYSWNIGDPRHLNSYVRLAFVLTNFPFFIPVTRKVSRQSVIVVGMGAVSTLYHSHQFSCWDGINRKHTAHLKWLDLFITAPMGFYIILVNSRKINRRTILLGCVAFMLYVMGVKKRTLMGQYNYVVLHGIWHILIGYVFRELVEETLKK